MVLSFDEVGEILDELAEKLPQGTVPLGPR